MGTNFWKLWKIRYAPVVNLFIVSVISITVFVLVEKIPNNYIGCEWWDFCITGISDFFIDRLSTFDVVFLLKIILTQWESEKILKIGKKCGTFLGKIWFLRNFEYTISHWLTFFIVHLGISIKVKITYIFLVVERSIWVGVIRCHPAWCISVGWIFSY